MTATPFARAVAGAQAARWTGAASALAGLILIAILALATTGAVTPWLMLAGAVLLGGISVVVNGLIGREMAQRKELQRDLRAAAAVQRSLLPTALPELAGCEFAMSYRMSHEIGGADGVTERRQGDHDYGVGGLLAAAARMRDMPAQIAVDALLADSDRFAGGIAADDDLTIVVVRATP